MYTAVYTLAAVCMFVYTAVNMLAADGAVFTHLYSPPPSSAVSQRSEHEVHTRIARALMGCWKFLCISSLAQRSFSSGVSGSNSPSRCASQQPRSFASLCRHPLRHIHTIYKYTRSIIEVREKMCFAYTEEVIPSSLQLSSQSDEYG